MKQKKYLSVIRQVRVILFSELTLETVIKKIIQLKQLKCRWLPVLWSICLTRTGFKISIIVHYSFVDPDAYFEMLLHHAIADHWWQIVRCRVPIIWKGFKTLCRQTEMLLNWIWISAPPVSITELISVCKHSQRSQGSLFVVSYVVLVWF